MLAAYLITVMWFWAATKPRKYRKPEQPEVKP